MTTTEQKLNVLDILALFLANTRRRWTERQIERSTVYLGAELLERFKRI